MNCKVELVYQLTVCSEAEENRDNLIDVVSCRTVRMCTEYLSADWRLNQVACLCCKHSESFSSDLSGKTIHLAEVNSLMLKM